MKIAVVLLALVAIVHADMYLHNPRCVWDGSLPASYTPVSLQGLACLVACWYECVAKNDALFCRGSNNRLDEARRDRNNANRYGWA